MQACKKLMQRSWIMLFCMYLLAIPAYIGVRYLGYSALNSTSITLLMEIFVMLGIQLHKGKAMRNLLESILTDLQMACDPERYMERIEDMMMYPLLSDRTKSVLLYLLGIGYYYADRDELALDYLETTQYARKMNIFYRAQATLFSAFIYLHKNDIEKAKALLGEVENSIKQKKALRGSTALYTALHTSMKAVERKIAYQTKTISDDTYVAYLQEREATLIHNLEKAYNYHGQLLIYQQLGKEEKRLEYTQKLASIDGTLPMLREAAEDLELAGGDVL